MKFTLDIQTHSYPTRTPFRISRSTVTAVDVVQVSLGDGQFTGRGECRPYPRYKQTVDSVTRNLNSVRRHIESGHIKEALTDLKDDSAARNALESAWVDYQAKHADLIGTGGLDQVLAVSAARPDAKLIIDANEALDTVSLPAFLSALSGSNIALIEQPLPAGHQERLPTTKLKICADEGLHTADDLAALWELGYRAVNVKLDKCGGPIAARDLVLQAKDMGFTVMAGCMVGSSLAMAPMMTLESLCDVIDLDGALLLAEDIENGLRYKAATIHPPTKALWG